MLARLVTGDDAAQAKRAAARIDTGDAFFVSLTVALDTNFRNRAARAGLHPQVLTP